MKGHDLLLTLDRPRTLRINMRSLQRFAKASGVNPLTAGNLFGDIEHAETAGTVVPNHKLGSTSRGDSIHVTYNIADGLTAQQLSPILALHKRDIISTITDAKRRRTPLGAAL